MMLGPPEPNGPPPPLLALLRAAALPDAPRRPTPTFTVTFVVCFCFIVVVFDFFEGVFFFLPGMFAIVFRKKEQFLRRSAEHLQVQQAGPLA